MSRTEPEDQPTSSTSMTWIGMDVHKERGEIRSYHEASGAGSVLHRDITEGAMRARSSSRR